MDLSVSVKGVYMVGWGGSSELTPNLTPSERSDSPDFLTFKASVFMLCKDMLLFVTQLKRSREMICRPPVH